MTYKDLWYFTGHCLALDEHPQFREKIIELFADAVLSLSKDANPLDGVYRDIRERTIGDIDFLVKEKN